MIKWIDHKNNSTGLAVKNDMNALKKDVNYSHLTSAQKLIPGQIQHSLRNLWAVSETLSSGKDNSRFLHHTHQSSINTSLIKHILADSVSGHQAAGASKLPPLCCTQTHHNTNWICCSCCRSGPNDQMQEASDWSWYNSVLGYYEAHLYRSVHHHHHHLKIRSIMKVALKAAAVLHCVTLWRTLSVCWFCDKQLNEP